MHSHRLHKRLCLLLLSFATAAMAASTPTAYAAEVNVTVDTSQVADSPALVEWAEQAKKHIHEWHPRISNLLASKGFEPPTDVRLVIRKQDKGVGHTAGKTITIMSGWIEKRPDDLGLVIHELTHVIQRYKRTPSWVTEGVADYIRWAIYEGKELKHFHCPNQPKAYTKGYQVTAGFLLWLESDLAPGIVSRLNRAGREGSYKDELFEQAAGVGLDELWERYRAERHP